MNFEVIKTILISLLLFPSIVFANDFEMLCKGEEAKSVEEDPNLKEVTTKVIGIQLYEEGMR